MTGMVKELAAPYSRETGLNSYPFLNLARARGCDYGVVLLAADLYWRGYSPADIHILRCDSAELREFGVYYSFFMRDCDLTRIEEEITTGDWDAIVATCKIEDQFRFRALNMHPFPCP